MSFFQPVKWLFSMAPEAWPLLLRSVFLACLAALLFPIPIFMAWFVMQQFITQNTITSLPFIPCLIAIATIAISSFCRTKSSILAHKAAFSLGTGMCTAGIEHLGKLPMHWFSTHSSGELKKILRHDIEQIEGFIAHNITDGMAALLLPIISIIALFFVDVVLALLMLALMVFAIMIHVKSIKMIKESSINEDYYNSLTMLHSDAVELVHGMQDIKIFNRSAKSFSRMQNAIQHFKKMQSVICTTFVRRWAYFLTVLTMSFGILGIAGAYLHLYMHTPLENILLFLMLGSTCFMPLARLVRFVTYYWRSAMAYTSIKNLLDTPTEICGIRARDEMSSSDITIEGLCASYAGKSVLHDINFIAKAGTVTAIVGQSGSGKSTIAAVLAGMEKPDAGRILAGGIPLQDFAPSELTKVMSIVFQQPFIFSGTVAENIALGVPNASIDDIKRAANMVQCQNLIDVLPKGYETLIGTGGTVHLSGGQRQRIALARMALRNTPIVLLDEATAFADPESELAIQEGLSEFLAQKTVLVIAHRLPSIAKADSIIVIDEGRIVERGRHDELMAQGHVYARMWEAYTTARSWMLSTDKNTASTHKPLENI